MKIELLDARTRLGIVQAIAAGHLKPLGSSFDLQGRDVSTTPVHLRSQAGAQAYLAQLAQQQPAVPARVTPTATPSAPAFSGGLFAVPGMGSHVAPQAPQTEPEFSSSQTYDNARDPRVDVAKTSYQTTTVYQTK